MISFDVAMRGIPASEKYRGMPCGGIDINRFHFSSLKWGTMRNCVFYKNCQFRDVFDYGE